MIRVSYLTQIDVRVINNAEPAMKNFWLRLFDIFLKWTNPELNIHALHRRLTF